MTTQEKRIAIAEACGWKQSKASVSGWQDPDGRLGYWPDDYLNDRNAMIEVIKTLPPEQQRTVAELLCGDLVEVMLASAQDLADAFLKTIGKL